MQSGNSTTERKETLIQAHQRIDNLLPQAMKSQDPGYLKTVIRLMEAAPDAMQKWVNFYIKTHNIKFLELLLKAKYAADEESYKNIELIINHLNQVYAYVTKPSEAKIAVVEQAINFLKKPPKISENITFDIRNSSGQSLIMVAEENSHSYIYQLLDDCYGAIDCIQDNNGLTLLDYACTPDRALACLTVLAPTKTEMPIIPTYIGLSVGEDQTEIDDSEAAYEKDFDEEKDELITTPHVWRPFLQPLEWENALNRKLVWACGYRMGNDFPLLSLISALCQQGADINTEFEVTHPTKKIVTPLINFLDTEINNSLDVFKLILAQKPTIDKVVDNTTALLTAISKHRSQNQIDKVKILLEHKADLGNKNGVYERHPSLATPLQIAIKLKLYPIIELLIDNLDPNLISPQLFNKDFLTITELRDETLTKLIKFSLTHNIFSQAAKDHALGLAVNNELPLSLIKQLVSSGADCSIVDHRKITSTEMPAKSRQERKTTRGATQIYETPFTSILSSTCINKIYENNDNPATKILYYLLRNNFSINRMDNLKDWKKNNKNIKHFNEFSRFIDRVLEQKYYPEFLQAIRDANYEKAKILIKYGLDINKFLNNILQESVATDFLEKALEFTKVYQAPYKKYYLEQLQSKIDQLTHVGSTADNKSHVSSTADNNSHVGSTVANKSSDDINQINSNALSEITSLDEQHNHQPSDVININTNGEEKLTATKDEVKLATDIPEILPSVNNILNKPTSQKITAMKRSSNTGLGLVILEGISYGLILGGTLGTFVLPVIGTWIGLGIGASCGLLIGCAVYAYQKYKHKRKSQANTLPSEPISPEATHITHVSTRLGITPTPTPAPTPPDVSPKRLLKAKSEVGQGVGFTQNELTRKPALSQNRA